MRTVLRLGARAALSLALGCAPASAPPAVAPGGTTASPALALRPPAPPAASASAGAATSQAQANASDEPTATGRGWVAKVARAVTPRPDGGRDVLTIPLREGPPMECHVFVETPPSIVAALRQAVTHDPDASLDLESLDQVRGQPELGFMVGAKQHLTMVRYLDDLVHPVLCAADRSPLSGPFDSAAHHLFTTLRWQVPALEPLYSELRKRTTDTTVAVMPPIVEAGRPPTQHIESRLYGSEWTFAVPGTAPGEVRVVERSFVSQALMSAAVETITTERANAAQEVTALERRRSAGGQPETTLTLTVGANGSCHYEQQGGDKPKAGDFRCAPRLASVGARERMLKAADGAPAPFDATDLEYLPDLAVDRAILVHYARVPTEPPHVVRIVADQHELVVEVDDNGRIVETALATARGEVRSKRIYRSSSSAP